MRRKRQKADPKKIQNEFESFTKKMLASKHGFWFEVLNSDRKFRLFILWKQKKHEYKVDKQKPISFNKFIFKQRQTKKFHVPLSILRYAQINKILN
jgi:hypothetical protein